MSLSPKEELIGLYARFRWLKTGLALLLALLFIQVGRSGPFWAETSLRDVSFDVIFAVIITYCAFSLVEYIQVRLDVRYGWSGNVFRRIAAQLGLGVGLPLVVALSGYVGYGRLYYQHNFDLSKSLFFKVDVPVAFLMLVLVNAYYSFIYLIHQVKTHQVNGHARPAEKAPPTPAAPLPATPPEVTLPEATPPEAAPGASAANVLLVNKGQKQHVVEVGQIAYLALEGELTTVRLFDNNTYWMSESLESLERKLPAAFFRVNRQCIVNFRAVQSFVTEKSGRLVLDVAPETDAPMVVSQRKAPEFRAWLLMH